MGTQSHNTGTHKEGEEGDILFIVVPYPIRYCPYAAPINRQQLHQQQSQRRKKRNVQWHYYHLYGSRRTIHYLSHRTRHTILIVTSSRMVGRLSSVYQVIPANTTPSYTTINVITQLYVYVQNNSVVIILGGTDGHGHDNKFNKYVDIIQHTNPLLSFCRTYQHNHI